MPRMSTVPCSAVLNKIMDVYFTGNFTGVLVKTPLAKKTCGGEAHHTPHENKPSSGAFAAPDPCYIHPQTLKNTICGVVASVIVRHM